MKRGGKVTGVWGRREMGVRWRWRSLRACHIPYVTP
jgi:hypothetical protein